MTMQSAPHRPGPTDLATMPDGPVGWPILGVLPDLRRDPFSFLATAVAEHGDFVPLKIGPKRGFILNHPEHVRHVLQDNHQGYAKSHLIKKLKPVLGDGLLTAGGDLWRRQRKLMQPKFTAPSIQSLAAIIRETAVSKLERMGASMPGSSGVVDVQRAMTELTLEVIVRTMFSTDISADASAVGDAITALQEEVSGRMWSLTDLGRFLPTKKRKRAKEALALLDEVVRRTISARRRARTEGAPRPGDLMDLLLDAMEDGGAVDERQLRDEVVTMFAGGHETTANGLTWTFALLGEHPWAAERLQTDREAGHGGYVRLVIQESMRLHPPIWWFAREAVHDDVIGGMRIPAGSMVIISQHLLHRHPDFWTAPDQFDPERFLPERSVGRHKFAYIPFGAGPRICVGSHMAMAEMAIVLQETLSRFDVALVDGRPPEPDALVTLRPKGGLPMVWTKRPRQH